MSDPPALEMPNESAPNCIDLGGSQNPKLVEASADAQTLDPPAMKTRDFDLTQTFLLHVSLLKYAEQYSHDTGFMIRDDPKAYFVEKNWPFKTPFIKSVPRRGYLICSPKSRHRKPGDKCTFQVSYGWDDKSGVYHFKHKGTCLNHSHNLAPTLLVIGGRAEVNHVELLTPEEQEYIKEQSVTRVDVPTMQVNLENRFVGRAFTPRLLYYLRDLHLDSKYGKDRMQLSEVFLKGEQMRRDGGVFVAVPSPEDFGIDAIHFQTRLQGSYADIYHVFKMLDGTFNLSQHDTTFVVFTTVDGLLRTKITGCTICFTENSIPIIDGARLFFPCEVKEDADNKQEDNTSLLVGELAGFFDPFVDSIIKLDSCDGGTELPKAARKCFVLLHVHLYPISVLLNISLLSSRCSVSRGQYCCRP